MKQIILRIKTSWSAFCRILFRSWDRHQRDGQEYHQLLALKRPLQLAQQECRLYREIALRRPARSGMPSYEDLSLPIPESIKLPIDREEIDVPRHSDLDCQQFREEGVLIKPGFVPEALTAAYLEKRRAIKDPEFSVWGGSYMAVPEMRAVALYTPLMKLLKKLIGREMGLFLTLSGLQTTKRTWHQDYYLKPAYTNVEYVAVWIALDSIHPESGPFEYIPGSQKWPPMRRELVWEYLQPEQRDTPGWPRYAEAFVTPAYQDAIAHSGIEPRQFVGQRGDILIWHHSLVHQGSLARNPELERPGLIAHYASLQQLQLDRKTLQQSENKQWYVLRNDRDLVLSKRRKEKH
ncbi:protein involved in biosynthesis of mitomycin antibiotics/polyketide fumonisin [Rubidibacter lacunae KORDI 51-2]|uniref:Protein involved in biosynthesis of mitomycin antibiotics/polyketide fumonisin n=1 Tax=Rubidibacter lacunae KORDI 51-2 TaxID=582515 RepID=U5DM67_9CHRO|nr:phytanoyl-CoA dioxygenase family protein [Rubidibacter lacunae]ERN41674.1 protein involved in biosynthesis of mitomycin antibiotics/polyketide fumonisin [Rubidibacter lacunae KORDI 51-2]